MSFLKGLKKFGRGLLGGLKGAGKGVLKVGRKAVDGVNRALSILDKAKNIPVIGEYAKLAENIPQVQLLRAGVGLADAGIGTGEALQRGDFGGAIRQGRETAQRGVDLRRRLK